MILFATKAGPEAFTAFPYAFDLARTLKKDLAVLLVTGRKISDAFEETMMAATFAQAGDFTTVREILHSGDDQTEADHGTRIAEAKEQCREAGIDLTIYTAKGDEVEAIRDTAKIRPGVDMVLLSPSLGAPKTGGHLKRILARIAKPVITISQQVRA